MKKLKLIGTIILALTLLSGCLYPKAEKRELETADALNIEIIQKAVDQYREKTGGLLPIKTRDQNTDQYIRYPIDFEKLLREGVLEKYPTNSFEKGGLFQYVIWKAESKQPVVKVVDLQQAEAIREISIKKGVNGYVPLGENVSGNIYELAYDKMGLKIAPTVPSPYSSTNLPIVIKGTGEIVVDYSIELQKIVNEKKPKVKKNEDIRYLLEDQYPILPAFSAKYILNNEGEVAFFDDRKNK